MYYELYVDVLFLVNFFMDYVLLQLVNRMLKCHATHGRICVGAGLGAGLTCIFTIIYLPMPYAWIKLVLFHTVINTSMIRVGLHIKQKRVFGKAFVLLYIGAFLMGGFAESVQGYFKFGGLFLAVAVMGYHLVLGIWNFIARLQRVERFHCSVELYYKHRRIQVEGVIDTGNSLHNPVTHAPIHILDRRTIKDFLGELQVERIQYVPYHSIGKETGMIPTIQIDKMCVSGEEQYWIYEPWIGVSEERISSDDTYHMILHPQVLEEGETI